jgi:tRNA(Arg) A34 adenosine deaminase TadA
MCLDDVPKGQLALAARRKMRGSGGSIANPRRGSTLNKRHRLSDEAIIRELVAFTRAGLTSSHPIPFGAEIRDSGTGQRLVRKLNRVMPDIDPTAHAEVRAIRFACKKIGTPSLRGYTLYSTCEPCPMCMTAALFAGVERVVYGTVVRPPDSPHPPLFAYSAKKFARSSALTCRVDGPVEELLCRALVDDPVVRRYAAKCAKKHVLL